jgi:CheY-like chemotaxis protein
MLRSRGFDVVVASNGDAALAAILSDGADGLVADFEMPGLNVSRSVVCSEACATMQFSLSSRSPAWERPIHA